MHVPLSGRYCLTLIAVLTETKVFEVSSFVDYIFRIVVYVYQESIEKIMFQGLQNRYKGEKRFYFECDYVLYVGLSR